MTSRTVSGGGIQHESHGPVTTIHRIVRVAAALALLVVSCSRGGQTTGGPEAVAEVRPGIALPASGTLVLTTTPDGLFAPMSGGSPAQVQPQPFAVAVAPAAIQPLGDDAIVAVNRIGLVRLSVRRYGGSATGVTPGGQSSQSGQSGQSGQSSQTGTPAGDRETRIVVGAIPGAADEFAGRTVAVSWADRGGALFLLYRHPMFETELPRDPPSVLIEGTADAARLYMGTGWAANDWRDAYAVYPTATDAWLVQYRAEDGERVVTRYATIFKDAKPAIELKRQDFEKAVFPANLDLADPLIVQAASAIEGPVLLETRYSDGTRKTWLRGDPGEAAPAWAYVGDIPGGGKAALVVTDDWRIVLATEASGTAANAHGAADPVAVRALYPPAALPGARVRDAALVDGLAVLVWEEDLFPDIGASGLTVIDLALDAARRD